MRNTVSITKSSSAQVKPLGQKVIKLSGAAAGKSRLRSAAPVLRSEKTERSVRSASKPADIKQKKKASAKAAPKAPAKAAKPKAAPKRRKAETTQPAVGRLAAGTSSGTATTVKKNEKASSVHHLPSAQDAKRHARPKELVQAMNVGFRMLKQDKSTAHPSSDMAAPAKLTLDDIKVFQIHYLPEHQPHLDADFTPYDNSGNTSRLFEFSVFTKLAQSDQVKNAALWGAMSWKFGKKAGVTGRQFKEEIVAHPGYDAYYTNPFPENEALYHNMWVQGEIAHPNFMPLCTEIFEVAGLPADLLDSVQPSSEFSAANYFVANQAFWKAYIAFVSRVLITADKKLSPTAKRILYSSTADKFGAHAEASYIPFLIERLFAVFLRTDGAKFKTFKLKLAEREKKENVHLKLLSEMKDVACRTKSAWMAACWINYRNLYLAKTFGDTWTKHNLKRITPANIVFMRGTV